MNTIEFTLLVEPKSCQHGSRAGLRGGKIHFYNDSEKVAYQTRIILESKHHAPREPLKGPLAVIYEFYLPRAKSNKAKTAHGVKPDLVNLAKHTEDALTKAGFWEDDKQIVTMTIVKAFTEPELPPRIEVIIHSL